MVPEFGRIVVGIFRKLFGVIAFFTLLIVVVHVHTLQSVREIQEQYKGQGLAAAAGSREALADANRLIRESRFMRGAR